MVTRRNAHRVYRTGASLADHRCGCATWTRKARTRRSRVSAKHRPDIEWSPDGKTIAFGMLARGSDAWRINMPAAPRGAKWTEAPRVVTKLKYRADRTGFLEDGYRQLFVVPADGGTPRQVTTGDWAANGTTWTTDGSALLFTSLRTTDAEYAWRESEIYSANVVNGAITQLTHRKGPDGNPLPSPNGRMIAYSGYDSTDATWKDASIYVMDADGRNSRVLTDKFDRAPQGMIWADDNLGIYFTAEKRGWRATCTTRHSRATSSRLPPASRS